MPVTEATYRQLAEEDFENGWELVCGRLRKKPGMTLRHNSIAQVLTFVLQRQIPLDAYRVSHNQARLRLPGGTQYIPDVVVVPVDVMARHFDESGVESYAEPLPLVVEVWSPSTGEYDIETKLLEYQARGDLEIWRVDPRDHSITSWVRSAPGSYTTRRYLSGSARPAALPGVIVPLSELFQGPWN